MQKITKLPQTCTLCGKGGEIWQIRGSHYSLFYKFVQEDGIQSSVIYQFSTIQSIEFSWFSWSCPKWRKCSRSNHFKMVEKKKATNRSRWTGAEIVTDKVDSEVPSPAAGVLSKRLFEEGQVVKLVRPRWWSLRRWKHTNKCSGSQPPANAPAPVPAVPVANGKSNAVSGEPWTSFQNLIFR